RMVLPGLLAIGLGVSACGASSGDGEAASAAPASSASGDVDVEVAATDFGQSRGAIVANTGGTVTTAGAQRIMTAIIGPEARPFLGGPDASVTIDYRHLDGDATLQAEGTWLTTNASTLGLYVTNVEFPSAGQWEVVVSSGDTEIDRTSLTVTDESSVPRIGDQAPPTDSPVGATADEIAAISTDPEPDPSLYRLSIADAVGNGRPTMVAFVTPGFCQTALCGPTLEAVKGATAGQAGLDVVHVEPFELDLARAGDLRPVPAMAEWGLQTEPWVFVLDADGTVRSSFEGIIGQDELEAAVEQLRESGDLKD
ncbi:MAG: hypothetical protein AAFO29_06270, partial [Actinomycetota bacterium]